MDKKLELLEKKVRWDRKIEDLILELCKADIKKKLVIGNDGYGGWVEEVYVHYSWALCEGDTTDREKYLQWLAEKLKEEGISLEFEFDIEGHLRGYELDDELLISVNY